MNRLLAKLPRSSKGSRELSASSRAAAFPADILDVSIIGADPDLAEDSFAPVSALICSGGASRGDFISLARTIQELWPLRNGSNAGDNNSLNACWPHI